MYSKADKKDISKRMHSKGCVFKKKHSKEHLKKDVYIQKYFWCESHPQNYTATTIILATACMYCRYQLKQGDKTV